MAWRRNSRGGRHSQNIGFVDFLSRIYIRQSLPAGALVLRPKPLGAMGVRGAACQGLGAGGRNPHSAIGNPQLNGVHRTAFKKERELTDETEKRKD